MLTGGMSGAPYGISYVAAELVADIYDFDIRDPELFDRFRTIESEYMKIQAEDAAAEAKRRSK